LLVDSYFAVKFKSDFDGFKKTVFEKFASENWTDNKINKNDRSLATIMLIFFA
jgi:hypothetical protein